MSKEYKELCDIIIEHNHHYYVDMKPIISNDDYDSLVLEILTLEDQDPSLVTYLSPTQDPQLRIDTTSVNLVHNIHRVTPCRVYNDMNSLQSWMHGLVQLAKGPGLKFIAIEMCDNDAYYIASYRYNKPVRVVKVGTALMSCTIPNKFKELPDLHGQKFSNLQVLGKLKGEKDENFIAEGVLSNHTELFSWYRDNLYMRSVGFETANMLLVDTANVNVVCKRGHWKVCVLDKHVCNQIDTSMLYKDSSVIYLGEV